MVVLNQNSYCTCRYLPFFYMFSYKVDDSGEGLRSFMVRSCLPRHGVLNGNLEVTDARCFDLKDAADREELLSPAALSDEFEKSVMEDIEYAYVEVCQGDDCNTTPNSHLCRG